MADKKSVKDKKKKTLDKYFDLWELLALTQHAIYNVRELELREYGITPNQAYVLKRIHQLKDKATQVQIAHFTFRKQNTVSINMKRMEKQGLLTRNRNEDRKNLVMLSLTKKGEEAYKKSLGRQTINNVMSSLTEEQIDRMHTYLDTLFTAAANELAKFNNETFLKSVLDNLHRK